MLKSFGLPQLVSQSIHGGGDKGKFQASVCLRWSGWTMKIVLVQGLFYWWAENICFLFPEFRCHGFLKPTGGSPDVVYLIKYASKVSECQTKVNTSLEAENSIFWRYINLDIFSLFWEGWQLCTLFSQPFFNEI